MQDLNDNALLREYVERASEEAFATLVTRHVNRVYSVALRHTGNPLTAEEITQAVFVVLAGKARHLGKRVILSGWLYQTARLTAVTYIRSEIRRSRREQEAHLQTILNENESETWAQIAPLLDAAMARLNETDRRAVVLRFFDGKSLREVGTALGANENAARMRLDRALEKLRLFFTKRGISSTTTIIAGAISAHSVQAAPEALAKTVTAIALGKGATASGSTITLIKGTLKIMAWTKAKTAFVAVVIVLLSAGTATVTIKEIQNHWTYPWQVANGNSDEGLKAMNTTPPQVTIVRSKYTTDGHGSLMDDVPPKNQWRLIGIHSTLGELVKRAYSDEDSLLPCQFIWPTTMPSGFYDYIANLPSGSQQALQALIRKKFGIVATHEMRDMDVLLLEMDHPNARGLRLGTLPPPGNFTSVTHGMVHFKNFSIFELARYIKNELQVPVIDQTGLTEHYDIDFPDMNTVPSAERIEKATQVLLDEFGLKLVPSHEAIEMLVVEKVK